MLCIGSGLPNRTRGGMDSSGLSLADMNQAGGIIHAAKGGSIPHTELSWSDYRAVNNVLTQDQSFWRVILPLGRTGDQTAVVLESRLGSTALGLAPHFSRVIALHPNLSVARMIRQRATRLGISNVTCFVFRPGVPLAIRPGSIGAFVLYDPDDYCDGIGIPLSLVDLESLLLQAGLALNPTGCLLVAMNTNRSRPIREVLAITERFAGFRMAARKTNSLGSPCGELNIFVSRGRLSPGPLVLPEFSDARHVRGEVPAESSVLPRIKARFVTPLRERFFPSAFLIRANRRSAGGFLESVLNSAAVKTRIGWSGKTPVVVQRLIAGNGNVIVVLAGPRGKRPNVVVRIGSDEGSLLRCRRNARALQLLSNTSLSNYVPRLLLQEERLGLQLFYETVLPGSAVDGDRINGVADFMLVAASEKFLSFQLEMKSQQESCSASVAMRIRGFLSFVASEQESEVRDRLNSIAERVVMLLVDQEIPLLFTHGDFKIGNILFDRNRNLCGYFDWDRFSEYDIPLLDYVTAILYKIAKEHNYDYMYSIMQIIRPSCLREPYMEFLYMAARSCNIPRDLLPSICIICWLRMAFQLFSKQLRLHRAWRAEFVEPVIPLLEKSLT